MEKNLGISDLVVQRCMIRVGVDMKKSCYTIEERASCLSMPNLSHLSISAPCSNNEAFSGGDWTEDQKNYHMSGRSGAFLTLGDSNGSLHLAEDFFDRVQEIERELSTKIHKLPEDIKLIHWSKTLPKEVDIGSKLYTDNVVWTSTSVDWEWEGGERVVILPPTEDSVLAIVNGGSISAWEKCDNLQDRFHRDVVLPPCVFTVENIKTKRLTEEDIKEFVKQRANQAILEWEPYYDDNLNENDDEYKRQKKDFVTKIRDWESTAVTIDENVLQVNWLQYDLGRPDLKFIRNELMQRMTPSNAVSYVPDKSWSHGTMKIYLDKVVPCRELTVRIVKGIVNPENRLSFFQEAARARA